MANSAQHHTKNVSPSPRFISASPDTSTFSWLLRLRWLAVCGQAGMLVLAADWFGLSIQHPPLIAIVFVTILSNVLLALFGKPYAQNRALLASVVTLDIALLTLMIHFSGGPENPFSIVYLLHVVLAAVLLGQRWAWGFALVSSALFGLLYFSSINLASTHGASHSGGHHAPFGISLVGGHFFGMWVAYCFVAVLTAYCISRITEELRRVERQTEELRLNQQRLASLTTLAAGAAHELSTPLATITLTLGELRLSLGPQSNPTRVEDDLELVESQLHRCKEIIAKMSGNYGHVVGESLRTVSFADFGATLQDSLTERFGSRVQLSIEEDFQQVVQIPAEAITQAVIALTKNGIEASNDEQSVLVSARAVQSQIFLTIEDSGSGIPDEHLRLVGEPFFTTKDHDGMGLGIFLARLTSESIGGSFSLSSELGKGTTATLQLPQRITHA